MSSFTMQLRAYIEHFSQYDEGLTLDEKIQIARPHLFDFYYPFFDEEYKNVFETNFIKYFYMNEIGQETEGLFKLRLENWLNINMHYYNKLFESEQLEYDPLENVKLSKEKKRNNNVLEQNINKIDQLANTEQSVKSESNEKQNGTSSDESFNRNIFSDTPEDRLQITTGSNGSGAIEYASNIEENKGNGSNESESERDATGSSSSNGTSDVLTNENRDRSLSECLTEEELEQGKMGVITYQEMIMKYRETFINVERKIFENIKRDGLFMLIYG